jgi:hypothetical protein
MSRHESLLEREKWIFARYTGALRSGLDNERRERRGRLQCLTLVQGKRARDHGSCKSLTVDLFVHVQSVLFKFPLLELIISTCI